MKKSKIKKRGIQIAIVAVFFCGIFLYASAVENKLACYLADGYQVHGVDVSHYQGEIDWKVLEEQNVSFAFIKATEGSGHVDTRFHENWEEVTETDIRAGAYHFFSFDSSGETQAELYIRTVGDLDGRLLPVIDVEYYGDKASNPPTQEELVEELLIMLELLEEEYGVKPMIYTTYSFYYKFLKGEMEEYPLWIRNVYFSPNLDMYNRWSFWQYTDQAILDGYEGGEEHIDRNVFLGTLEELQELVIGIGQ